MNKIINYFFEEDEIELVNSYQKLIALAIISLSVIILVG